MASVWVNLLIFSLFLNINLGSAVESGSIIPLYIYPKSDSGENTWQKLLDTYNAHPIKTWAIVNVFNGPGNSIDSNFVSAIASLHAAGINTLGYVRTDYTRRSQSVVKTEIDLWKQWYNTNGIFFDEMAYEDNDAKVQYYRDVGSHAKAQGFTFTVGNPGTRTSPKYFSTVDNIVVFESDTGFPATDLICSQDTNGNGRNSVSILPYNIRNLDTAAVSEIKTCAGYIYVTDDYGMNPWDTLPNYLPQLFQTLEG